MDRGFMATNVARLMTHIINQANHSANLTPDENTGIGSWSEETFVRALRTGRHMGVSRPILPPMPWGSFRNLDDEDLRSIYAYLRTVPPVHNRVPEPIPAPEPGASAVGDAAEKRGPLLRGAPGLTSADSYRP